MNLLTFGESSLVGESSHTQVSPIRETLYKIVTARIDDREETLLWY